MNEIFPTSFAFAYFFFLSSSSGSHRLISLPPLRVLQTKRFPSSIMKFFKVTFSCSTSTPQTICDLQ
ncbi:unnamed protein product [Lactuca virosa]|uniref:Secreted protein n=1 Tax=Lactuca virosa TaxID=75947 RepID=A0AAU9P6C6_9ASTR|nr:unnamed protein product [Lactuca virosa]